MSVWPMASDTREPEGTGSSIQQRREKISHQDRIRIGLGPQPMATGQVHLGGTSGGPWSRAGSPTGAGKASGTKGGEAGREAATSEIDEVVHSVSSGIAHFSSRVQEGRVPTTTRCGEI